MWVDRIAIQVGRVVSPAQADVNRPHQVGVQALPDASGELARGCFQARGGGGERWGSPASAVAGPRDKARLAGVLPDHVAGDHPFAVKNFTSQRVQGLNRDPLRLHQHLRGVVHQRLIRSHLLIRCRLTWPRRVAHATRVASCSFGLKVGQGIAQFARDGVTPERQALVRTFRRKVEGRDDGGGFPAAVEPIDENAQDQIEGDVSGEGAHGVPPDSLEDPAHPV